MRDAEADPVQVWSDDDNDDGSRRAVRRRPSPPRKTPALTRARGKAPAVPSEMPHAQGTST